VRAKLVLLIFLLLTGLGVESLWAASDKIDWHTYESGMARSRFEKKKVFLYFHADWCTYCVEMERKTFKDSGVIATLNRDFIPIRVDADREKAVASLYRPRGGGLPDLWFLTENEQVIGHRPGFISSDQLLKILTAIVTGSGGK
jgi:thioredoxin-related protein